MKKYLALLIFILLAVSMIGFGCGKATDETTTTTAAAGGTTTSTSPAGTTTVTSGTTSSTIVILNATENCTAIQNNPTSVNYMSVIAMVGWDGVGSNESFIKFDLSSIPAATAIQSATLKLFISSLQPLGIMNLNFYDLASNWSETSLTWNNKPGTIGSPIATKTVLTTDMNATINIDITAAVQAWINGTSLNNGIVIINPDVSTINWIAYSSKTSPSNRPRLEIVR